jgi:hypothetical protein
MLGDKYEIERFDRELDDETWQPGMKKIRWLVRVNGQLTDTCESKNEANRLVAYYKQQDKTNPNWNMKTANEVSPPGWGGTTLAMKKHHKKDIDNPWALSWWMKNKGAKPHYKNDPDGTKSKKEPVKKEKYKKKAKFKEWLEQRDPEMLEEGKRKKKTRTIGFLNGSLSIP